MARIKPAPPTPDFRKIFHLAEHYSEASALLEEQAKGDAWGCSGPQLMVDSFAVELYLKCLYVLDTNVAPPWEHDWRLLFDSLTANTKLQIREAFERLIRADPVLPLLPVINPEAVKVLDFDRSLTAARSTFDERRYLYDGTHDPKQEWFYAHLLRQAIRNVTRMDVRLHNIAKSATSTAVR